MKLGPSRITRRKNTKFQVCPSCAVSDQGWSVWGYHGKGTALRRLVQHRVLVHGYEPRSQAEKDAVRKYV